MIRHLKSPPKGDAGKDKPICREIEKTPEIKVGLLPSAVGPLHT